jgi:hypothetical protein
MVLFDKPRCKTWLINLSLLFIGLLGLFQTGCDSSSSSLPPPSAITTVFPPQGSDGALVTTGVIATFRDDMNAKTIDDTSFTLALGDTQIPVSSVTYDVASKTATLTPASDLIPGSVYQATVNSTVENTSGDTPLATNYVWSFSVSAGIFLASENESGVVGNNNSEVSDIDGTGRYIVFESTATNLDPDITTSGLNQIFRKDTVTGEVKLVSSDASGRQVANNASFSPAISDNGRYVVFQSTATNLSTISTGGIQQIFIKDLGDGSVDLVSRDASGLTAANTPASNAIVSADGRYVIFESGATNLSTLPANGGKQIYRKNMLDDSIDMVSLDTTLSGGAAGLSSNAEMSNDGRFIVFVSNAINLVNPAPTAFYHVYFVDMNLPDTIELISVDDNGTNALANSFEPAVSDDGRYVVFVSDANNLATPDNNGSRDVFLRDRTPPSGTPVTILVSVNPVTGSSADNASTNATISSNGSYIAFQSNALDLSSGNNPGLIDIYVRNVAAIDITINQINIPEASLPNPTVDSGRPVISKNGRYVSFDSLHKYTSDDTNGLYDVYRAYNSSYQ